MSGGERAAFKPSPKQVYIHLKIVFEFHVTPKGPVLRIYLPEGHCPKVMFPMLFIWSVILGRGVFPFVIP